LRYWFATRPAFILATLTACMLGQAGAIQSGVSMDWRLAVSTWCLAAVLHAAVNVLNDYVDAKNGRTLGVIAISEISVSNATSCDMFKAAKQEEPKTIIED
jgi:1,4-dihydroxy-2-naphthoate octaprenyltransferase